MVKKGGGDNVTTDLCQTLFVATPTDISATVDLNLSIRLTWSSNTAPVESYKVYVGDQPDFGISDAIDVIGTTNSEIVYQTNGQDRVYFRIAGIISGCESLPTDIILVIVGQPIRGAFTISPVCNMGLYFTYDPKSTEVYLSRHPTAWLQTSDMVISPEANLNKFLTSMTRLDGSVVAVVLPMASTTANDTTTITQSGIDVAESPRRWVLTGNQRLCQLENVSTCLSVDCCREHQPVTITSLANVDDNIDVIVGVRSINVFDMSDDLSTRLSVRIAEFDDFGEIIIDDSVVNDISLIDSVADNNYYYY